MGRRRKIVLAVGALVIAALVFQRQRMQLELTSWLICRSDAPGPVAMQEMVERSTDPGQTLQRLWDTQKIVQREFVLDYLRYRGMTGATPLWPAARLLTLQAANCGDMESQQAALTVLAENEDAQAVPLAVSMLRDVDPDVRRNALIFLQQRHDKRLAPVFAQMLDDPNTDVRNFAAAGLAAVTDRDFGLHFNADEQTAQKALAMWKNWWSAERVNYAALELPPASQYDVQPVGPAINFTLKDLSGQTVRLSDFKGKLVLITFWATWCQPCMKELPSLAELHTRRAGDIVVLAISADAIREHDADNDKPQDVVAHVKQFAADNKLPFRILIDSTGQVMGAYNGGDLPVSVWVDRNGMVRRRFIGTRPAAVLEQMADSIDPAPVVASVARPQVTPEKFAASLGATVQPN